MSHIPADSPFQGPADVPKPASPTLYLLAFTGSQGPLSSGWHDPGQHWPRAGCQVQPRLLTGQVTERPMHLSTPDTSLSCPLPTPEIRLSLVGSLKKPPAA